MNENRKKRINRHNKQDRMGEMDSRQYNSKYHMIVVDYDIHNSVCLGLQDDCTLDKHSGIQCVTSFRILSVDELANGC